MYTDINFESALAVHIDMNVLFQNQSFCMQCFTK